MTQPFLGEIRIFGGSFAPRHWALCNGQLLPISQNTALFSIIGTYYGGNGTSNFALPNLQGSAPLGAGQGIGLTDRPLGEAGGQASVTLTSNQMPVHTHAPNALSGRGTAAVPTNNVWAEAATRFSTNNMYTTAAPNVQMNPSALGVAGGGAAHNNMPPYLRLTFIIALNGVFPARN
jgi:microcystin-dependent protein